MAEPKFNYDILAVLLNATSVQVIERVKEKQNGTISDTDPAGAMKFTIAVVLVYGVGVIGLLGISARRNRRVELMDREVNKYIKSLHGDRPVGRKTKSKKSIYKLISSLHARNKSFKDDNTLRSIRPDRILRKSLSWTAGVTPGTGRKTSIRGAGRPSRAIRTVLKQIAENQSEEAMALNESSPHILASSSPTLHLGLSTFPQNDHQMTKAPDVSSSSVDVQDEAIRVTIVTPREEKQETVVNVSSPHDIMVDREQSDDPMHCNTDRTDHLGASANDMVGREMLPDKSPQVVVVPSEELIKGQGKEGDKRLRKVISI